MPKAKATPRGRGLGLLSWIGVGVVVIGVALLTQRALAEQVGRVIAGAWVSTMGAVLGLIGAIFGG